MLLRRVAYIGGVGVVSAGFAVNHYHHIRCQPHEPNNTKWKSTGIGNKLFNGFVDIANKLSDGFKNGELFHELKRKEVQMELIMIILPLIFGAFTSYRLYLHRKKSQKMALNKWINKDFHDVLNISLNTIVRCRSFTTQQNGRHINPYNYHIHYRTLIEKDAKSVINDEHGIAVLTSSLKKCVDQNQEVIRIDGNHKNDRDAHC